MPFNPQHASGGRGEKNADQILTYHHDYARCDAIVGMWFYEYIVGGPVSRGTHESTAKSRTMVISLRRFFFKDLVVPTNTWVGKAQAQECQWLSEERPRDCPTGCD